MKLLPDESSTFRRVRYPRSARLAEDADLNGASEYRLCALVRRFLLPGPRSLARIITAKQRNDNSSFVRPAGVSAGRVRIIQLLLTAPCYLTLLRFYGIMRQHDGGAMVQPPRALY